LAEDWAQKVRLIIEVGSGRLSELGMVQAIEELGANLQFDPLGERSGFGERDVEIGQGRPAEQVAGNSIGSVGRVIYGIELRETGIGRASILKVRIVLERHVGEAIGVAMDGLYPSRRC